MAYRVTTPSERAQLAGQLQPVLNRIQQWRSESAPFRAALRDRAPWLIVTPALVIVNTVVFIRMIVADASLGSDTLLAWGATEATRTAGGEWWRLVTATFIQTGTLPWMVTAVAIVQVGPLVERLIGPSTLAVAYVAGGAFGHSVGMASDVIGLSVGPLAAICALYGVLLAGSAWGSLRRTAMIPPAQYKLLAPGAALIIASGLTSHGVGGGQLFAGATAGVIIGLAGAMTAGHRRKTWSPMAFATAVALVTIATVALPVRHLIFVREQLAQLLSIEDDIARAYGEGLREFAGQSRAVDAEALTTLITGTIVPKLTRAATAIAALEEVPPQQQPLVESAKEYLRLREASWRLRVEGLRKPSVRLLQEASSMEHASIEALRPLEPLRACVGQPQ